MYELRCSTVEQWRRALETEYTHEEEVVASIMAGQDAPPAKESMQLGTDFHSAVSLQPPDETRQGQVRYGRYWFRDEDIDAALIRAGMGQVEVTCRKVFDIDGTPCILKGTADHVMGKVVADWKTKTAPPDIDTYLASVQWRAYLLLFDGVEFIYHLAHLSVDEDQVTLKDIASHRFWWYENIREDVLKHMRSLLVFCRQRGLLEYLELVENNDH